MSYYSIFTSIKNADRDGSHRNRSRQIRPHAAPRSRGPAACGIRFLLACRRLFQIRPCSADGPRSRRSLSMFDKPAYLAAMLHRCAKKRQNVITACAHHARGQAGAIELHSNRCGNTSQQHAPRHSCGRLSKEHARLALKQRLAAARLFLPKAREVAEVREHEADLRDDGHANTSKPRHS